MSAGETLRLIRERKPLVHQITNYVVMNETANATLALGALPVMAHAREEVEEMAALASALVLNIGTLSARWVEAMLLAGAAANARGVPVVLDPVGAGATRYRTETAKRLLGTIGVTVLRGNPGEVATLVGVGAEVRGVESMGAGGEAAELAREAGRRLGLVASVTGAVDHVSDGARVLTVANGDPLLAAVTGTGCISSALTGCFLAAKPDAALEAAAEALAAFGVAAEDAARTAAGPGSFHAGLYDALAALDPATLDARVRIATLDVGELGLLAELERRGLARGIEHDAAQLRGGLVVTQDALVEGFHFRLDWISWRELGFRAAAVNLSDLAASGAEPEALVVTLALPAETALADVLALYEGLNEPGVPVVGGDTTGAPVAVLSVTALGRSERVPGRAGAIPGDLVVVTGSLGRAGAAFREGRYERPPLRLAEGRSLARVAHALMDVSDGLGADAARIARRSGCRIEIELDRVPLGGTLEDLGFGEDYELLAATPDALGFPVIGACVEGEGVELRLRGEPVELSGWQHFKSF